MTSQTAPGRLTLTGSLFIGYVCLLAVALAVTGALWALHLDRETDRQYAERVLTVARSVAVLPEVVDGLQGPHPVRELDPLADSIAAATGADYLVIASPDGIRHTHPDKHRIGEPVSTPPGPVVRGSEWTGVQDGTQGRTVRAKIPVFAEGGSVNGGDARGAVVGYVSLGILDSSAATDARASIPVILAATALVLTLGVGGSWALSRQVRAKTHGLEPADITALLESREALLYAVREGVLAVDRKGRVVLVNQPARTMLGLPDDVEGRRLDKLGLSERVRDIVTGVDPGDDRILLSGDRVLVANRMPVRIRGVEAGAVVTLRDRTEVDRLTGELDGARTVTRGLRAQTHEFANRVHTVAGMLELGAHEEARTYLADLAATHTRTSSGVAEHVRDPALAALTLAKSAQASELGVDLRLSPMTSVPASLNRDLRSDALLILGNLVDNALDAVTLRASSEGTYPASQRPSGTCATFSSVDSQTRNESFFGLAPAALDAPFATGSAHRTRPEGWVELMVRLHAAADTGLPHDLLEIRVTDSGQGVSDDVAEEIFRYGFTTKASRDGGTRGLGLALVKQVCESRGGSIEMEAPDAEEGAVFTACLPGAAAAVAR